MFVDLRFRVSSSQIFLTRSSDAECSTRMGVMCPVTAFGIDCSHHAATRDMQTPSTSDAFVVQIIPFACML